MYYDEFTYPDEKTSIQIINDFYEQLNAWKNSTSYKDVEQYIDGSTLVTALFILTL